MGEQIHSHMQIGEKVTMEQLEKAMYWFHYYWQRFEVWGNDSEYIFWNPKDSYIETIISKRQKTKTDETQPRKI